MATTATSPQLFGGEARMDHQMHAPPQRSMSIRDEDDQEERSVASVCCRSSGNSGTSTTFEDGEECLDESTSERQQQEMNCHNNNNNDDQDSDEETVIDDDDDGNEAGGIGDSDDDDDDDNNDDDSVCMVEDLQQSYNDNNSCNLISLLSRSTRENRANLTQLDLQRSVVRAEEACLMNHRSLSILEAESREQRILQNQKNRQQQQQQACHSSSSSLLSLNNSKKQLLSNNSCNLSGTTATPSHNTRRSSMSRPQAAQQLELLSLYASSSELALEGCCRHHAAHAADQQQPHDNGSLDSDTFHNSRSSQEPQSQTKTLRRTISRGVERTYSTCSIRSRGTACSIGAAAAAAAEQRHFSPSGSSSLYRREMSALTLEIPNEFVATGDNTEEDENDDDDLFEPLES